MKRTRITPQDLLTGGYTALIEAWVDEGSFPYVLCADRYSTRPYLRDVPDMMDALIDLFEEEGEDSLPKSYDAFANALHHGYIFKPVRSEWELSAEVAQCSLEFSMRNTVSCDKQRAHDVIEIIENDGDKLGAFLSTSPALVNGATSGGELYRFLMTFPIDAFNAAPIVENIDFLRAVMADGATDPIDLLLNYEDWDSQAAAWRAGVPVSDIFA